MIASIAAVTNGRNLLRICLTSLLGKVNESAPGDLSARTESAKYQVNKGFPDRRQARRRVHPRIMRS
jgi:hypothetical protein